MTDTEWKYQVSPKLADGTLVNIRGNDPFDFKKSLEVVADLAPDIAKVTAALSATTTLANAGITGTAPAQPQASNGFDAGTQQQVQQYQQSAAQSQPQYAAPQQANVPVCKHGPMTFRSGTGKRGAWTAHFCPAPKGDPSQCEPIWGN